MAIRKLWVEEYRPKNLDDYVFQDESQKNKILSMIENQEIPHLLFCGIQGSGKTALARIIIDHLGIDEMDLMTINASDKNGIDYIRDTISSFAETLPMGKMKIVHLEEFDFLSQAAQAMLRVLLEETSDTCRFICTCNYENKIIPAIRSRMQIMHFKAPDEESIFIRTVGILDTEKIDFDPDVLFTYIRQAYPDIRKIINNLELNSIEGKLLSPKESGANSDYKFKILELIEQNDFSSIYELVLKNVPQEEIESLYEYVWQNLKIIPACKDKAVYEKAVLVIADCLRSHAVTAFPHITFQSMCIKLIMVLNG